MPGISINSKNFVSSGDLAFFLNGPCPERAAEETIWDLLRFGKFLRRTNRVSGAVIGFGGYFTMEGTRLSIVIALWLNPRLSQKSGCQPTTQPSTFNFHIHQGGPPHRPTFRILFLIKYQQLLLSNSIAFVSIPCFRQCLPNPHKTATRPPRNPSMSKS